MTQSIQAYYNALATHALLEAFPPTPQSMEESQEEPGDAPKLQKKRQPKFFTFSDEHLRASKNNQRLELPDESVNIPRLEKPRSKVQTIVDALFDLKRR